MKFGRKYRLTINNADGSKNIVIQNPFTINFTINRSQGSQLNNLDIDIVNLSEQTRNQLFQDFFIQEYKFRRTIQLEAGYDTLSTIFKGTIQQAGSYRQGVDIVTSIKSLDGGWDVQNTNTYSTLEAGETRMQVMQRLINDHTFLQTGAISQTWAGYKFQRAVVLEGNTYGLLKKYSDNKVFIDLEKIYVLQDNEALDLPIPLLSAETGILDTPYRQDSWIMVSTIFEPNIQMAQAVDLVSSVQPLYNRRYKVCGIQHQGTISDAVAGDLRTTFNLFDPTALDGKLSFTKLAQAENSKSG